MPCLHCIVQNRFLVSDHSSASSFLQLHIVIPIHLKSSLDVPVSLQPCNSPLSHSSGLLIKSFQVLATLNFFLVLAFWRSGILQIWLPSNHQPAFHAFQSATVSSAFSPIGQSIPAPKYAVIYPFQMPLTQITAAFLHYVPLIQFYSTDIFSTFILLSAPTDIIIYLSAHPRLCRSPCTARLHYIVSLFGPAQQAVSPLPFGDSAFPAFPSDAAVPYSFTHAPFLDSVCLLLAFLPSLSLLFIILPLSNSNTLLIHQYIHSSWPFSLVCSFFWPSSLPCLLLILRLPSAFKHLQPACPFRFLSSLTLSDQQPLIMPWSASNRWFDSDQPSSVGRASSLLLAAFFVQSPDDLVLFSPFRPHRFKCLLLPLFRN